MIPAYNQVLTEPDAKAVYDVVMSQYITHLGKETKELEEKFAAFCNRKYAITMSNGTTALHLAIKILNLDKKGTIIIPSCTFASVGFAPSYDGYKLEILDVDERTWNLDLDLVEKACKDHLVSAVIAVHNYGNPVDMDRLLKLANVYGFKIIEDACEALTAKFDSKPTGSFGDVSVFSFYGNKLITGGEGGMLLVNDPALNERARFYRGQAQSAKRRFWHEEVGFNYRMTNIQSALIMSQFKRISALSSHAKSLAMTYQDRLPGLKFQETHWKGEHSWWMVSVLGNDGFGERAAKLLQSKGVETRPVFPPLSDMPAFSNSVCPVARKLNSNGITLPGGPGLTLYQAAEIADTLGSIT